jgi:hypothetical protein
MSQQARQAVVDSPKTFFTADSQRSDLLDENLTNSNLIALIQYIIAQYPIEFTAIRTDHHDDGPTEHAGGLAFDGWPLKSNTAGDWLDDLEPYLAYIAKFPGIRNIGLAGSAYTQANVSATGLPQNQEPEQAPLPCVFQDGGADHVHHNVFPA